MEHPTYRYIYGPVSSWRLGQSLGIDPLSCVHKTCTFDCVYCQAGKTEYFPLARAIFVPTETLIEEIRTLPETPLDFITFAGNGEPTLALNLGEMIREIRRLRKEKIAVITNASLLDREDVQQDLLLTDLVEAKLDAGGAAAFKKVNRAMPEISWDGIVAGLKTFRKMYKGHLALQVMFVASNQSSVAAIAELALEIHPDEVEINTPLRESAAKPLSPVELEEITKVFRKICGHRLKVRSVYEVQREKSKPFNRQATEKRRGKEVF